MRYIHFVLCLVIGSAGYAQSMRAYYEAGMKAYAANDYVGFYQNIVEAGKINPYHQGILYQRAKAAALTGKSDEALQYLRRAILINASYPLADVADFSSIKETSGFREIVALQKEWLTPLVHSDTFRVVPARRLHAEGIAYLASGEVLLGSIHQRKVVRVDAHGKISDFCSSGFNGMTSVFGLQVDEKNNRLWVCSSPMEEMEGYDTLARSAVFAFELSTGKMLMKVEDKRAGSVFGDILLTRKGDVLVSDGRHNRILTIDIAGTITELSHSDEYVNLQGIALSEDEKKLFVADYVRGVAVLDLTTHTVSWIDAPAGVSMKGIDGLYRDGHALIAVQNGVHPMRVTKYVLDENGKINSFQVLERAHPAHGEPTLGTIRNGYLYYIANSAWGGYDENHRLKPDAELKDIVILRLPLK